MCLFHQAGDLTVHCDVIGSFWFCFVGQGTFGLVMMSLKIRSRVLSLLKLAYGGILTSLMTLMSVRMFVSLHASSIAVGMSGWTSSFSALACSCLMNSFAYVIQDFARSSVLSCSTSESGITSNDWE